MTLLELIGSEFLTTKLLLLTVGIADTAFAVYVFAKNPKNWPNRIFAAFAGCLALWTTSLIVVHTAVSPPILDRFPFVAVTVAAVFLFALVKSLPQGATFRCQWDLLLVAAAGMVMALLCLSPLVYVESIVYEGRQQSVYGSLHPAFGAYMMGCFAASAATLWRRIRHATGRARIQLQYVLVGVLGPVGAAMITNLLYPLITRSSKLSLFGPLIFLFMIALVAHAIVRHRLMDIRVVIRQGTVYALTGVVLATTAVGIVVAAHLGIWAKLLELIGDEYPVIRSTLAAVVIMHLVLGFYVYRKNPKGLPNRMFAALTGSIALWALGLIFVRTASSPPILDRLAFVGGTLAILFLLALLKSLPEGATLRAQWDFVPFGAFGGALVLLSLTPLVYREAIVHEGRHQGLYGPLYPVFGAYVLSAFVGALAILLRRIHRTTGRARLQLQYLLLFGFLGPAAGGVTTNLVLPLFFGTSQFAGYGPLFTLPMPVVMAHAIIRHRLMDIRVVIRQGTVYALTGVVLATPAVVMVVAVGVWIPAVAWRVIVDALLVGAVALLAAPLRNRLDRAINAYVYRERYNSHQTLRDATQRLAQLRPLDALVTDLSAVVDRVIRPEAISIWLPTSNGSGYQRAAAQGRPLDQPPGPDFVPQTSALASWLRLHSNQPLLRDDPVRPDPAWQPAIAELANQGAELAVPISATQGLEGILLLGPKLSGDPYFDEDLTLLSALGAQAAVALANERLHQEDLNRVKELEAETRRVERLATLGAMASGIAHEIRNPLVAIKTHFQLMPEECTCDARNGTRQFAAVAIREIDRIDALLDRLTEMRDFPRASFRPVDLGPLLMETLFLLQARLTHDSVTVVHELEPACVIRGDREQLKQLFLNLLVNAKEALADGGQICVRCRVRREHPLPSTVVEISDTGPGIAETVQETIFEPFVTTKRHGTGLGLALCRAIADVHRGTIRADNRVPGPGAVFTVEFPRDPPPL